MLCDAKFLVFHISFKHTNLTGLNVQEDMACPRENTGSYLITEVKSSWTGLIPGWATILVSLTCCIPWEVRFALYSRFMPPTSAITEFQSIST